MTVSFLLKFLTNRNQMSHVPQTNATAAKQNKRGCLLKIGSWFKQRGKQRRHAGGPNSGAKDNINGSKRKETFLPRS